MCAIEKFDSQIDELVKSFPSLRKVTSLDGTRFIRGQLDVVDTDGKLWATYEVEIHPHDGFPYRFPIVFETSGMIPRIADWHIYEDTNSCCLAVEPEELLVCRNGITLVNFVSEVVLPYFFNQTHRKVEGYYKNGEFSHGLLGIYEFYDEALNTNGDINETIRLMIAISNVPRPGRTHACFCGSGKKFRHCHREAFAKLSPLGESKLKADANAFIQAISNRRNG